MINPEIFWRNVKKTDNCWIWIAHIKSSGYGESTQAGKMRVAHRIAYELLKGPIPTGLVIDHLCRNRACVNPDHLEPVTQRENILRGTSFQAENAKKTHCKRGHPFDERNSLLNKKGSRICRRCRNDHSIAWVKERTRKIREKKLTSTV